MHLSRAGCRIGRKGRHGKTAQLYSPNFPNREEFTCNEWYDFRRGSEEGGNMKNLFESDSVNEVISRIDRLQPASQRQWGKMNVAQMMAHCSAAMDMACGQLNPPRIFIGRLIGPLVKPIYTNEKPFSRNSPTEKKLVVLDDRDFQREQERLKLCVTQFHQGGESKCTRHPHPFFGSLTPQDWSRGMYKHLDHHLRQFGA
jgi:Protein of unknown function (DUF1569).